MPKDEWLNARNRDIARRATWDDGYERVSRCRPPRRRKKKKKPKAKRTVRKPVSATPKRSVDGVGKQGSRAINAAGTVQGRIQQGKSVWYLPPPYNFDRHPVPSRAELDAMFG